jgi:hypothetical protein
MEGRNNSSCQTAGRTEFCKTDFSLFVKGNSGEFFHKKNFGL